MMFLLSNEPKADDEAPSKLNTRAKPKKKPTVIRAMRFRSAWNVKAK